MIDTIEVMEESYIEINTCQFKDLVLSNYNKKYDFIWDPVRVYKNIDGTINDCDKSVFDNFLKENKNHICLIYVLLQTMVQDDILPEGNYILFNYFS